MNKSNANKIVRARLLLFVTLIKKTLRIILLICLSFILGIILLVVAYDLAIIYPYQKNISDIIDETSSAHLSPPEALAEIIDIDSGYSSIKIFVVKRLVSSYDGNLLYVPYWHIQNILWHVLIDIHLTDEQMMTLWCHFIPYEHGFGLNNSAQFHYGKDLGQLTLKELASIVAVTRSPYRYKIPSEENAARVDTIMNELKKRGYGI